MMYLLTLFDLVFTVRSLCFYLVGQLAPLEWTLGISLELPDSEAHIPTGTVLLRLPTFTLSLDWTRTEYLEDLEDQLGDEHDHHGDAG